MVRGVSSAGKPIGIRRDLFSRIQYYGTDLLIGIATCRKVSEVIREIGCLIINTNQCRISAPISHI